jgi:hypothetical protein
VRDPLRERPARAPYARLFDYLGDFHVSVEREMKSLTYGDVRSSECTCVVSTPSLSRTVIA